MERVMQLLREFLALILITASYLERLNPLNHYLPRTDFIVKPSLPDIQQKPVSSTTSGTTETEKTISSISNYIYYIYTHKNTHYTKKMASLTTNTALEDWFTARKISVASMAIIICNLGIETPEDLTELDDDDIDELIKSNKLDNTLQNKRLRKAYREIKYGEGVYSVRNGVDSNGSQTAIATLSPLYLKCNDEQNYPGTRQRNKEQVYDLFLSHKQNDDNSDLDVRMKDLARSLNEHFTGRGTSCFLDKNYNGNSWNDLPNLVASSKTILILLSKNFVESPWCVLELLSAIMHTRPIAFFRISDTFKLASLKEQLVDICFPFVDALDQFSVELNYNEDYFQGAMDRVVDRIRANEQEFPMADDDVVTRDEIAQRYEVLRDARNEQFPNRRPFPSWGTKSQEETNEEPFSNDLNNFLIESKVNITGKVIAAFRKIGIESVDDVDDLDEDMVACLVAAMKPLDGKRFRQSLIRREQVGRETATRENERKMKEIAKRRQREKFANEMAAKEQVASHIALRKRQVREDMQVKEIDLENIQE